jgi:hypothetical protein
MSLFTLKPIAIYGFIHGRNLHVLSGCAKHSPLG